MSQVLLSDEAEEASCVRLLLSVDLVGSTAFKQRQAQWLDVFKQFYTGFPTVFERKLKDQELPVHLRPQLIKAIGDELFMQVKIAGAADARRIVSFFAKVLKEYKRVSLPDSPLHVKGTAWVAGFPINNNRVTLFGNAGPPDYIGPSIDTGFRLTRFSSSMKLVVSVDLALLLLHDDDLSTPLHFDGVEILKGVLDNRPYPLVWHPVWHQASGHDHDLMELERAARPKPDSKALFTYCSAFVDKCMNEGTWLFRPYFEDDPDFKTKPPSHDKIFADRAEVDKRNFFRDSEPAEAPSGEPPPVLEKAPESTKLASA